MTTFVPRTSQRMCHAVAKVQVPDTNYGFIQVDDRKVQLQLPGANIVGSITDTNMHAPALDVDFPAHMVKTSYGWDLWVDAPLKVGGHRRMLRTLHKHGLSPRQDMVRSSAKIMRRRQEWNIVRSSAVDDSARTETLVVMGPELSCTFDEAVSTSTALSDRSAQVAPPMRNPWRVPLLPESFLIPSTSNSHLYVEAELTWEAYEDVLTSMVEAGLVQPGYLGASRARQSTFLRLPWVKKDASGLLKPVDQLLPI